MSNTKKIIALLLTAIMLFSTVAIAAYADENGKNVLVTIITDKTDYSATDTAKVTVKVENKSGQKLTGVVISAKADNWRLAKGSASNVLDVGELDKGAGKELKFDAVVYRKASGIKFFFDGFILLFKQMFNKPGEFESYSANDKSSTDVSKTINHGGATVVITATCWYTPVKEESGGNGSSDGWIDNTHLRFGSYPQTDVTSSMRATLDPKATDWKSYNYYSGNGAYSDGKMVSSGYMQYCDVVYGGNKYRGVKFTSYRPTCTGFESTTTTTEQYQQENGYTFGKIYWFKFEPLIWRVLDPDTGLVFCENIIDSQAYNNYVLSADEKIWGNAGKTYYANNYYKSSIREWLTKDFYNTAFSEAEHNCMLAYACDNSCYSSEYPEYDSQNSTDKVFLLSYKEITNSSYGFNSSAYNLDAARRKHGTDYAKCQGLYVENSGSEYDGNSYWWLRTSGSSSGTACRIKFNGYWHPSNSVQYTISGICPAIKLDLKSL